VKSLFIMVPSVFRKQQRLGEAAVLTSGALFDACFCCQGCPEADPRRPAQPDAIRAAWLVVGAAKK
jgi:hypothetical protein